MIKINSSHISELVGTFFLTAVVIGSGIMAENLSQGNDAVSLLGNTIATGAILFVLIKSFSSISGAHFNPVVTLIFLIKKELALFDALKYVLFQFLGALLSVVSVHYYFGQQIIQISTNNRGGIEMIFSEVIATIGLIITILFVKKYNPKDVASAVALFITAGYWFTSSTSFANPAVTVARTFTDTFTGIAPSSVDNFITGQLIGSYLALILYNKIEKN
ncbi:MAG: aquaporin [Candidatus Neomarinimicrobiota bacterium]|tara:strand:- start:1670 stop:2326 length:657 start_codon:yes stop_codon:yes gene_type:complete